MKRGDCNGSGLTSSVYPPLCRCGSISTRFSRVPRQNLVRKSVRFVCGFAPLRAAAGSEPASEVGDARKHIEAEPMNALRFSMPCGGGLKTKPTSFLIVYRLWSKTPILGEASRARCSPCDRYCASSFPACGALS